MRAHELPQITVNKSNEPDEEQMNRLSQKQLHSDQIAFTENNNTFNCFYIDMNEQLQRIDFGEDEFDEEDDIMVLPEPVKKGIREKLAKAN